jgi:hypothetical protein
MTQDEIIAMARQAGSLIELAEEKDLVWLASFAKLVAQHEREACAKIVEEHAKVYAKLEKNPATSAAWAACIDIHDSISERGEA